MHSQFLIQYKTRGNKFTIRYPSKEDLKEMHRYINLLSKEQTFVNYQGEEISLKEERDYLNEQLKRIEKKQSIQLLAFLDKKIVGTASIDLGESTYRHEGVLGISVLKKYRDKGVGKILLEKTISEAEENLINFKIITLTVFGNNKQACEFYKKFGFKEFGRLSDGVYYKGKYQDRVYMVRRSKA